MSETRQWVERFEALRDDLATGDLYHVQKWVQNDGALTEIAEGIARLAAELEESRRERSAAKAEAMTAQASLRRAERELEAARERERHIEGQIVALVEAEVISEGKAREILGIGVEEWREIEDSRALAKDTEASHDE